MSSDGPKSSANSAPVLSAESLDLILAGKLFDQFNLGDEQKWAEFVREYGDKLTIKHWRQAFTKMDDEAKTPYELNAIYCALVQCYLGKTFFWDYLAKKHPKELNLDDFRFKPTDGNYKDLNGIWWMVHAAYAREIYAPFMYLKICHRKGLKLEDFRNQGANVFRGQTAIWIAQLELNERDGKSGIMKFLLANFENDFVNGDFETAPVSGPFKGINGKRLAQEEAEKIVTSSTKAKKGTAATTKFELDLQATRTKVRDLINRIAPVEAQADEEEELVQMTQNLCIKKESTSAASTSRSLASASDDDQPAPVIFSENSPLLPKQRSGNLDRLRKAATSFAESLIDRVRTQDSGQGDTSKIRVKSF